MQEIHAMNGLVVLAREPVPGKVKSRLARDTSFERAAALYRAFTLDTLEMCSRVPGVKRWIAYTPDDAGDVFASLGGGDFQRVPQGGGDLGDRLLRCFDLLFEEGCERVVVLGSDAPTLPPAVVSGAFQALEGKDVVIGPCPDGGYYLLGLARPLPAILEGISWGTEKVFAQTIRRVKEEGWSLAMLPPWYDVDTIAELRLLKTHLAGIKLAGGTDLPRHTFTLLCGTGSVLSEGPASAGST